MNFVYKKSKEKNKNSKFVAKIKMIKQTQLLQVKLKILLKVIVQIITAEI